MKMAFLSKKIIFLFLLCCIYACTDKRNVLEVKLISYNIRQSGLADKDGEYKWENRKAATLNMIEKESPSVFGLQEALLEQVEYIEQNCPKYSRIGVGRDDGKNAGEFMAIFYLKDKYKLLQQGTFWLSETPDTVSKGWDADYFRIVTWVKLQGINTKKEFYYFNTHFDNIGEVARKESTKLVAEKIKEIAEKKANIIFGGDLNSAITDKIFNPLKKNMKIARKCSTITDNKGTFNGFGSAPTSIILDHIFCKNIECKSFRTLDGDYGVPYISDHYPIEFVFEIE
ncbi:MAG: endonuclease/exonuclease/phosphatase family protein [Bacteroidales bacterium]|jgi:endonuclease/exonuclease/phosphatase family metal-dependent hydrolase|nr:endonuclease/exonuclease/phosphatase family protein [Bacteroidales bacterium]